MLQEAFFPALAPSARQAEESDEELPRLVADAVSDVELAAVRRQQLIGQVEGVGDAVAVLR